MTRAIKWAAFRLAAQRFSLISCHLLSQPWLSCQGWWPRCDCSHRRLYTPAPCTEEEEEEEGRPVGELKLSLCWDKMSSS